MVLLEVQVRMARASIEGSSLRGSHAARSLLSFAPDKADTAFAFWNAYSGKTSYDKDPFKDEVQKRITGDTNWPALAKAVYYKSSIVDAGEFAMFMANVMHESAELTTKVEGTSYKNKDYDWGVCTGVDVNDKDMDYCEWKENGEIVKETDITKCCRGSNCATKCDKHYSGRGYLQTTYYKNYKDASEAGCTKDFNGNSVDIVKNPELVEDDEVLAWCTAAVYWKKNVHGDRCPNGSKSCDMGNTISAINGALECGEDSAHKEQAQRRFCFYRHFHEAYKHERMYWADSVCFKGLDALCPV